MTSLLMMVLVGLASAQEGFGVSCQSTGQQGNGHNEPRCSATEGQEMTRELVQEEGDDGISLLLTKKHEVRVHMKGEETGAKEAREASAISELGARGGEEDGYGMDYSSGVDYDYEASEDSCHATAYSTAVDIIEPHNVDYVCRQPGMKCSITEEEFLGWVQDADECAKACMHNTKCSQFGTFVVGIGSEIGKCYSLETEFSQCERWTEGSYDGFYLAGAKHMTNFCLVQKASECAWNEKEHFLGQQDSLYACAKACEQDEQCKEYGTFIYGFGEKARQCWSEGVRDSCCKNKDQCNYEEDEYNFYKLLED